MKIDRTKDEFIAGLDERMRQKGDGSVRKVIIALFEELEACGAVQFSDTPPGEAA